MQTKYEIVLAVGFCLSCSTPARTVASAALVADDCSGTDDSATVQAAMTAGTCLESGVYRVDVPPAYPNGRRRDWSLSGGTLCGNRTSTTVLLRGDARGMFWVGVMDADVHDITLDSHCLTGTAEQNHLISFRSSGHVVRDAVLIHPRRVTPAGDDINLVGVAVSPMTGVVVDHVKFVSCARFGVQLSRGVYHGRITNSEFNDCAIGSENATGVDGLVIDHDTFTSSTSSLSLNLQSQTNLLVSHVTLNGGTMLIYHCDHCRVEHSSVTTIPGPTKFITPIMIGDVAHDVVLSDVQLTQHSSAAYPVIFIGPIRTTHQADLANISIISSRLTQSAASPLIHAEGVSGLTVRLNDLTYDGSSDYVATSLVAISSIALAPIISVPTTNVIESDNVLVGMSN